MRPEDLETVRTLLRSLMHTAAALDQIINRPAPEPEVQHRPSYLGDTDPQPESD